MVGIVNNGIGQFGAQQTIANPLQQDQSGQIRNDSQVQQDAEQGQNTVQQSTSAVNTNISAQTQDTETRNPNAAQESSDSGANEALALIENNPNAERGSIVDISL